MTVKEFSVEPFSVRVEKVNRFKEEAKKKPTVTCPRCGSLAHEAQTRFGIRSSCCGLWSYDRLPLVDADTHEARKRVYVMMRDIGKQIGSIELSALIKKRTGIGDLTIKLMNQVTCEKVERAMEDILIDVVAGDVKLKAEKK